MTWWKTSLQLLLRFIEMRCMVLKRSRTCYYSRQSWDYFTPADIWRLTSTGATSEPTVPNYRSCALPQKQDDKKTKTVGYWSRSITDAKMRYKIAQYKCLTIVPFFFHYHGWQTTALLWARITTYLNRFSTRQILQAELHEIAFNYPKSPSKLCAVLMANLKQLVHYPNSPQTAKTKTHSETTLRSSQSRQATPADIPDIAAHDVTAHLFQPRTLVKFIRAQKRCLLPRGTCPCRACNQQMQSESRRLVRLTLTLRLRSTDQNTSIASRKPATISCINRGTFPSVLH